MNDYFHLKTFASLVVAVDAVAATTALIARAKGERAGQGKGDCLAMGGTQPNQATSIAHKMPKCRTAVTQNIRNNT